jgi:pyruvate/2-oxoglutarate dehydrogenase complex dihydrolipoamide dehydrogenase (E3) component
VESYDLAVIGAGSGGDGVARPAAARGLRVALIERDKLGGECLNYGCDPTKTLYRCAEVASLARRGHEFGVRTESVEIDFAQVMARTQAVIAEIRGDDPFGGLRRAGIDLYQSEARFRSPNELDVGGQVIQAEKIVIAAGTSPSVPEMEGLDDAGYLTNRSVLGLAELPKQFSVLGGGAGACEFAQIFARLGADVTVVEKGRRLIATEDEEVSLALERVMQEEGIRVLTDTQALKMRREDGRPELVAEKQGKQIVLPFDRLLIAAGRRPNVEALNLDAAGVRANNEGIEVNDELRTTVPHIWAAGDIVGHYMFTHIASYHADLVFANAVEGRHERLDYSVVPWVIFTDPEVAHVGLTEAEARERGQDIVVGRIEFKDLVRAITAGETRGFGKIVADKRTGRILGANYICHNAGEIIHEVAMAMRAGMHARELGRMIHAYPTMAEGVRWAATAMRFE